MTAPGRFCRHTLTLTRRSLRQFVRSPSLIVLGTVQPIVLLLLFDVVFGGAISPGGRYLDLLLPGVAVLLVTSAAVTTGLALNREIDRGGADRFRALPIAPGTVLTGRILAETIWVAGIVLLVVAVGVLLGFRVPAGPGAAGVAYLLLLGFGVALSWFGTWVALVITNPELMQAVGLLCLFPLTFASSVFVPTSTMPGWLRAFAAHNPVTIMVDTVRALLRSGPTPDLLLPPTAWTLALGTLFALLALRHFARLGRAGRGGR